MSHLLRNFNSKLAGKHCIQPITVSGESDVLIKGGLGKGFMEEKGLGEGKGIQERGDKFSTSNETIFLKYHVLENIK